MTNHKITLTPISANLHRLDGAYGHKVWFSYDVVVAVLVASSSHTVWVTPTKYSTTTSKHVGQIKRWAEDNNYAVQVAASDDELNGWAA